MSDARTTDALNRIERALARIEAIPSQSRASSGNDVQFAQLDARHKSLKAETTHALAEINVLIAKAAA